MYWKNWKKVDFAIFDPKKSRCLVGLGQISGKPVKIVKKLLYYLVLGMFIDKFKKFCDHSMILWEMAGVLLTNGLNQPPPSMSFRVNLCHEMLYSGFFQFSYHIFLLALLFFQITWFEVQFQSVLLKKKTQKLIQG